MSMRGPKRLIALAVAVALSGVVAGCSTANFDPSDLLDFLDTKKKLPGERKPVFPEGVPGLEQGVPKDLYKGARQQQVDDPNAQAAAAPPPEPTQKSASKSKGKGKPPAAEPAAAANPDADEEGSTAAAPPAPKPQKIVRRRTTAPPPDPAQAPTQQAAPTQQQSSSFPAPMPSGTFSR
jgi:hypothetical protein